MKAMKDNLVNFFTRIPLPLAAFQLSARYLSGIHITPKEKRIKSHYITALEKGIIAPSFYKKNIHDPALLGKKISEGMAKLNNSGHRLAFLLPELSQKAFVFSFDSAPSTLEEKEQLIRFRVKKQMPLLPADSRLAYMTFSAEDKIRVVVSVAKAAVIQEYEDIFSQLKFKVKLVGVPSLSLLNVLDLETEKDFVLIDVEEDAFSLIAVVNSKIALYRQKPFGFESTDEQAVMEKINTIIQEVTITNHFIEDKEKRRIASLWIRLGVWNDEEVLFAQLGERLSYPLKRIESSLGQKLDLDKKKILSPLIGQMT